MTIWDALQALARRWLVMLLALMVGLGSSYLAMEAKGVYWSRAEVTFLAPSSVANPNTLKVRSSALIITAAIVARRLNGNATWNKMADPAVTIIGQGILDGSSVHLPDYGGQWSRVYSRQVLDVQVSGPTEADVRARQRVILDRIDAELAAMQEGVADSDRITTAVVPATPSVYYFHGGRVRALGMIWILTLAGAFTAAVLLEHRVLGRRAALKATEERVDEPVPGGVGAGPPTATS